MLSEDHMRQLHETTVRLLLPTVSSSEFADHAIRATETLARADVVSYAEIDVENRHATQRSNDRESVSGELLDVWTKFTVGEQIIEDWKQLQPLVEVDWRQFRTDEQIRADPIWQHYYSKIGKGGVNYQVVVPFLRYQQRSREKKKDVIYAMGYGRSDSRFTKAERLLYRQIAPILQAAYLKAERSEEGRSAEELVDDLTKDWDFRQTGTVSLTNEGAASAIPLECREWLREFFGGWPSGSSALPGEAGHWVQESLRAGVWEPLVETRGYRELSVHRHSTNERGIVLQLERRESVTLGLTPRERDVAVLLVQGKTNMEISKILSADEPIGLNTVKQHVASISRQLGSPSRTSAAYSILEAIAKSRNKLDSDG